MLFKIADAVFEKLIRVLLALDIMIECIIL